MPVPHGSQGEGVFEDLPLLQTLHVSLTATVFCGVKEICGGRETAGQAVSSPAGTSRGNWRITRVVILKKKKHGGRCDRSLPRALCCLLRSPSGSTTRYDRDTVCPGFEFIEFIDSEEVSCIESTGGVVNAPRSDSITTSSPQTRQPRSARSSEAELRPPKLGEAAVASMGQ